MTNPGDTFVRDGKTYHVRIVTDGVAEVIEDGVGDPTNPEFEPGAEHLQHIPVSEIPTTAAEPVETPTVTAEVQFSGRLAEILATPEATPVAEATPEPEA